MKPKERLIVALDVDSIERAEELVKILSPEVDIFKVGIAPFTAFGDRLLAMLEEMGKKVFLDLKVHDIPNTVSNAANAACGKKSVFMMNFHCLGGKTMLEAAVKGVEKASPNNRPLLIGVTILTSMDPETMNSIGIAGNIQEKVIDMALMAKEAGLDGVVASAKEARAIKEKAGEDFIVVTPGIRPGWAAAGDQKRVLSPEDALAEGADYLVVGRPIVQADDPLKSAELIIEEIKNKGDA